MVSTDRLLLYNISIQWKITDRRGKQENGWKDVVELTQSVCNTVMQRPVSLINGNKVHRLTHV